MNAKSSERRAVAYARRSTDRQEQSIPDQKKALVQYAEAHAIEVVNFYVDDAISGTSTLGRKAFQQMIADAQLPDRPWDLILVYDVKRLSRGDNDEAGHFRFILRQHGVQIIYVSENFSGDGTDDLLRPVKQWQAREESKDLSKVTIRGLLSRVQGGVWMGGAPPLGYDLRYENEKGEPLLILRYESDGSKKILDLSGSVTRSLARGESLNISKRDRAKLVPSDPARVQIVQQIFQMYALEGKGYRAIADSLNRQGLPSPRGAYWSRIYSGKWGDSTVREIIRNPVYVGDSTWNRRTDGRFHKISNGVAVSRAAIHSRRLAPNDKSDWIVVKDTHPALISRQIFEEACKSRAGRGGKQPKTNGPPAGGWSGSRSRFILSGLLFCEACGNRYQGCFRVKGRPRKDGSQIRNYYYSCSGYIRGGNSICRLRLVPQEKIEQAVTNSIVKFYRQYLGEEGEKRLEAAVRDHVGSSHHDVEKALRRARHQKERTEKKIANLLDHVTSENRDLVDERLKTLRLKKTECDQRFEQLLGIANSQTQMKATVEDLEGFLSNLESILSAGVPEEKRAALRRCLERISVSTEGKKVMGLVRSIPLPDANTEKFESDLTSIIDPKKIA